MRNEKEKEEGIVKRKVVKRAEGEGFVMSTKECLHNLHKIFYRQENEKKENEKNKLDNHVK